MVEGEDAFSSTGSSLSFQWKCVFVTAVLSVGVVIHTHVFLPSQVVDKVMFYSLTLLYS